MRQKWVRSTAALSGLLILATFSGCLIKGPAEPPPFCLAGKSVRGTLHKPFSEAFARSSDLHVDRGCDLMEYFLRA